MTAQATEVKEKKLHTRRLQIFELTLYMASEFDAYFDGTGFTAPYAEDGDSHYYPFNTAVKMYNERQREGGDNFVCDKLKLHFEKRNKRIRCLECFVPLTEDVKEESKAQGVQPEAVLGQVIKAFGL